LYRMMARRSKLTACHKKKGDVGAIGKAEPEKKRPEKEKELRDTGGVARSTEKAKSVAS